MSPFRNHWPPFEGGPLATQARSFAQELRLYRDLRYDRGDPESYRLTGRVAELLTAAELLELPLAEQERAVRAMLVQHHDYLRRLQGIYDA